MFIENYRETSLDRYISIEISISHFPNTVYLSLLVLFYASVSCIILGLKLKSKTNNKSDLGGDEHLNVRQ